MGQRITLVLDDEAHEVLRREFPQARGMGEYVSELIKADARNKQIPSNEAINLDTLRWQLLGLGGQVKSLEGRLITVEQALGKLLTGTRK
jgi:hypothetical protein